MNWRWNYNTGGGQLLDWIGHHGDIAHWGLGFDLSGPSEIEGFGEFPAAEACWNTATKYTVECLYKKEVTGYSNDVRMTIAGGSKAFSMGTKWIGTDGWVWVDRDGFDASNPEWVKPAPNAVSNQAWASAPPPLPLPDSLRKIKLYRVRRALAELPRQREVAQADHYAGQVAHHSTLPGHLGLISMMVGRKIHWDVKEEKIVGDEAATAMLSRPYRSGYSIA